MLERGRVEVGGQLSVQDVQDVAVELGGHARGVVVGLDEGRRVLHQGRAQEQPLTLVQVVADRGEELGAFGGDQVADRATEERDQAGGRAGEQRQVLGEVADHAVHGHRVVGGRQDPRGFPQRRLGDVEGDDLAERTVGAQGVQQVSGLLG